MQAYKQMFWIVFGILVIVLAPLIGAQVHFGGQFPENYFHFPLTEAPVKPGFELWYFLAVLASVLVTASLYLVPQLYGFKKVDPSPPSPRTKPLPWWFWTGWILAVPLMVLAWGKFSQPSWLVPYIYVPMFWAFALIIDGYTYWRRDGYSFLSKYSAVFFAVAFCSGFNWAFFDYLNFFLGGNWYYPEAGKISLTAFVIYAFLGSMTLAPMVFIAYNLVQSFSWVNVRYTNGPSIKFSLTSKYISLAVFTAGMFIVPFYPNELYPFLWICPTFIIASVLGICNIWTPLTPIRSGNWAPLALIALAGFVQGFLWEGMNYFSAYHSPFMTNIPGYWIYSIPYVAYGYIFEMPAMGFFGYMPYGLFCWMFWIAWASLLNIPAEIAIDRNN